MARGVRQPLELMYHINPGAPSVCEKTVGIFLKTLVPRVPASVLRVNFIIDKTTMSAGMSRVPRVWPQCRLGRLGL